MLTTSMISLVGVKALYCIGMFNLPAAVAAATASSSPTVTATSKVAIPNC